MDARTTVTRLDSLARAAVRIFRPLVRILIRHDVSYKTCADWLRWCYADVAYRDFRLPGRKPTKSRVAVLTGLTRVDVNQLLTQPAPDEVPQEEQYHRAALVLSGWANDSAFRADGAPLPTLPFDSDDDRPSFSMLVSRHSGGAPARAVLDELQRNGAVNVLEDRTVELVRTRYIARADEADLQTAEIFGMATSDLITTIAHNWQQDNGDRYLQLVVYNRDIHPDLADEAREKIEAAARQLAEQVDEWLYHYEEASRQRGLDEDSDPVRLGLGLYTVRDSETDSAPPTAR
ncbi:hypothetical protein HFP89_15640 [Wenzhouxiangella sp. XN79A]|uniref:DUF6502 family protein n=1 Tax=Wenzhouxiangella sp. XN79A TaxID=2724193 RepID=UPI00144AE8A2|nr:DUF6502 family protein [Wenzhouxiangella sp. XN79A]NKI36604.1 hypothetical protein [Wenzhouxiangella sp. XN79A]